MKFDAAISLFIALFVAVTVGAMLFVAQSGDIREYAEASEEWCEDRGGHLVNVHAVVHGGLHCHLPNGTSVHMTDVEEVQP